MNMEKIEEQIRMFDRIELIFAICAAAAAAALLIMIAFRMKRDGVKPGRRAFILAITVLAVTGIYTGTVVFAEGENGEENECPCMYVNENTGSAGEVLLGITGSLFEDCFLKLTVTDPEEAGEEHPETAGAQETAEEQPEISETEENAEEHSETTGAEAVAEEYSETTEAEGTEKEHPETTWTEAAEEEHQEAVGAEGTSSAEESAGNVPDPDGAAEEIVIGLYTGPQEDDAAAREIVLAGQAAIFDPAGLILKDVLVSGNYIRSLLFGLREAGRKSVKVRLSYGEDTQEIDLLLSMDEIEEAGHNSDEAEGGIEDGGAGDGNDGPGIEAGIPDGVPDTESETGQHEGGDVPEENHDVQEIVYEEGQAPGEEDGIIEEEKTPAESDEGSGEGQDPSENDEKYDEELDLTEEGEKNEEDEEPPVIIIMPDDEGSGFKVSADTKEAVSNVYISEAKEVRIIETNAEEIEEAEIVYTVNGETYAMEYGADYEIEKVTTDEGWQYEYVIAPHVFEKDGYYSINVTSKDTSGNISNNKTAGTEVSFVVDRTPPAIIVTNLAEDGVYEEGGHEYKVTLKDNTLLKYFRIYENKKLKAEYRYDREKWINAQDKTDVLDAPGGTVTLMTDASGETKTIEFEAEDESGNICRSGSYNIIAARSRAAGAVPFAAAAASLVLMILYALKHPGLRKR